MSSMTLDALQRSPSKMDEMNLEVGRISSRMNSISKTANEISTRTDKLLSTANRFSWSAMKKSPDTQKWELEMPRTATQDSLENHPHVFEDLSTLRPTSPHSLELESSQFEEISGNPNSLVNIVLIPGLHLNPTRQMSVWRTADFFWPKEISNQLPESRVLTWTFTSTKRHFVWDTESIHNLAIYLLNDIRKDFDRRGSKPLVFVSYSLGGLVLKRALVQAFHRSEGDELVRKFTKAIIFIGTPQNWTRQTWRNAIHSVMKAAADNEDEHQPYPNVNLQDDEDNVWRDTRLIRRLVNENSIPVLNVCETIRTSTNTGNVMVLPLSEARLDTISEEIIRRKADHITLAKFSKSRDPVYQRLISFIAESIPKLRMIDGSLSIKSNTNAGTDAPRTDYEAENLENILQMLSFDWMQEDWVTDCDEGTCQWIFKEKPWTTWFNRNIPGTLWISGSPGMGKTVLSKCISKYLRENKASSYTLSYFFDKSVVVRTTFKGLLRSLLHQLLSLDKELLTHLHTKSQSASEPLSTSILLRYVSTIIQDAEFNGAFIVIDGIDECTDPDTLLKFMEELSRHKIHLVITSRPEQRPRLDNLLHIPLNGAYSSTIAVRDYLKHECVRELPLPRATVNEFEAKLEDSINQSKPLTFLWIRLAVRLIAMQPSVRECRRELNTLLEMKLPSNQDNMPALLRRYLNQAFILKKNIPIEILGVLLLAKAPITIAGLAFFAAAILEPDLSKPDVLLDSSSGESIWEPIIPKIDENIPIKFEEEIQNLALVQLREDTVSLVHHSLRQILPTFLLKPTTEQNRWPTFTGAGLHYLMAQICITYAIFALQAGSDRYHLLDYACLYWFEHILAAKAADPYEEMPGSLKSVIYTFFNMEIMSDPASSRSSETYDNTVLRKWLIEYNNHDGALVRQFLSRDEHDQFSERALTFAILAAFDLFPALHFLVPDLTDEDFSHRLSKYPDNPASLNTLLIGNNSIRSLRWIRGSKAVNCISNWLTTYSDTWQEIELTDGYLELIAECGSPEVVEFFIDTFKRDEELLNRMASFHQKTAEKGHEEAFLILYKKILSRHMEDCNAEDADHIQRIAESAAELDLRKLVIELLQKWNLSSAHILSHAIQAGAEKTSEDLIARLNVNVNEDYGPKGSILHIASEVGSKNIVQALIERGCRINAMDKHRRVPLHIACQSGNLDVCKLLLNMNEISLLNYADDAKMLPLHYAANLCHTHIISLLLEEGSNVFAADNEGRAPLHFVCKKGSYSTAKILLQYGARPDVKDKAGRTPLHYAAMSANPELAWLLISYGASVSSTDDDGASPLHRASTHTSDVMVKRLVDLGSDPNAEDDNRHTPLYYLFHYSKLTSRAVFEALMTHGAVLDLNEVGPLKNYTKWLEPYKGSGKIIEISSAAVDTMSSNILTQKTWTDEDSLETSFYSAHEIH